MNVIWKRPDGFHGASPTDFVVVELGGHSRMWLHRSDHDSFPFRVSGGWEEEEGSRRLNNLVNLLNRPLADWVSYLTKAFHHSMNDEPEKYLDGLCSWLETVKSHLKGDTWEIEIMTQAVHEVQERLNEAKAPFLKAAKSL